MLADAEALYGLDPSVFVAERDRLVRALRADKRRTDATAVARLRRPLVAEHAVNLAARQEPSVAVRWADAVTAVESAQAEVISGGDGDATALRSAIAELRAATAALVDAAVRALGDTNDRDSRRNDIATVMHALTSAAGADAVRRGIVGAEPIDRPDLFAGVSEPPDRPPGGQQVRRERATPSATGSGDSAPTIDDSEPDDRAAVLDQQAERRAAIEALDAEIDAARTQAQQAAAAVTATADAAGAARQALDAAEARLDADNAARHAADRQLADLERQRDALDTTSPS